MDALGGLFFPTEENELQDTVEEIDVAVNLAKSRVERNIYYNESGSSLNTLDILIPDLDVTQKVPAIIHVHGGGWQRGSKESWFYGAPFMGNAFMSRGFVAVVVNYRKQKHPSAINDVADAIKWVVSNISLYNGDPTKIFLSGHSAGGHLISLLVTESIHLGRVGLNNSYIKGVICLSGIYTVAHPLSDSLDDLFNSLFRKFYVESIFGVGEECWSNASPATHLLTHPNGDNLPPFLICNAAVDLGLEFDGRKFFQMLTDRNVNVKYELISFTTHGTITRSDSTADLCTEFIYQILS